MAKKLNGQIYDKNEFYKIDVEGLFGFFSKFYHKVDPKIFEQDFYEKDYLFLLKNDEGEVKGFSNMQLIAPEWDPGIRLAFSGNTIIDPEYWGSLELVRIWARLMNRILTENKDKSIYWYLICSGFRTYMFLPVFFNKFYPNYNEATPNHIKMIIENAGRVKFPGEYENGIVKVQSPRECLDATIAIPNDFKQNNPNIKFFTERNPGYLKGDELVCMAEVKPTNFKSLLKKYFLKDSVHVDSI